MTNISYIVLGFAIEKNGPVRPFCVLSWLESALPSLGLTMRVSKNWREMIPDHFSTYVSELIEDWSQLSIDDPNTLIRMLRELSVGPIRTLEEGSIPGSALNDLLIKYLGHGVT